MHELKELVFISLYLYVSLGAVILMKTAVLHTQGIEFTPLGHRRRQGRGPGEIHVARRGHEDWRAHHNWPTDLADAK